MEGFSIFLSSSIDIGPVQKRNVRFIPESG
jgi:hypothetical protein